MSNAFAMPSFISISTPSAIALMKIKRAGVDIAKSVFHVRGVDCHDKPVWQVKRDAVR